MAHPKTRRSRNTNQLRIIGGAWRSRKLSFPDIAGLRPTPDRVRETLFNWLAPIIQGARCLDLFAGSGALGLEALSRGASEVVMIDRDPQVIAQLRAHIETLHAQGAYLVQADALQYLQNHPPLETNPPSLPHDASLPREEVQGAPPCAPVRQFLPHPPLKKGGRGGFDIVFLDPPFRHNLLVPCCQWLERYGWLRPGARIYLEAEDKAELTDLPQNWRITHSKQAGQVSYHLALRETDPAT
ncbi:MAG TPA: 16S rRNA (guanine(966)-N(2))-methyltransferase RsmD [Gammaproteobacteria bacterium]|nr:16S rRNA (guanine(966)-N(2))-methyltransferase RsmD [Gammaproteobacteria bacterium]